MPYSTCDATVLLMAQLVSGDTVNTSLCSGPRRSTTALCAVRFSDPILHQVMPSLSAGNANSPFCTPQRNCTAASLEDVPRDYLKYHLPDDCQVLKFPDNRHLAYTEYGSKAPDAHPFIFVHGIPDTRLDACLLSTDRAISEKLNIRWTGIDRPGMGLSTFHPNCTVFGGVNGLQCLIHHLKLDRYQILSVSGGTAYALACAELLPREQLRSVGIALE